MGKHDQDNTRDGHWTKSVPRDDVRDTHKDDYGGRHSGDIGGREQGGKEQGGGRDTE